MASLKHPSCLQLLGLFDLTLGNEVTGLSLAASRVLAFLAISGRPAARVTLAEMLWRGRTDVRAQGNLRSVLWRMPKSAQAAIADQNGTLS
jgi:DNA-binding SARP family transcriptional activator